MYSFDCAKFVVTFLLLHGTFCPSTRANWNQEPAENYAVCTSRECKQTAVMFSNHINSDVSPCENFYEYACGKIKKSYESVLAKWGVVNTAKIVLEDMKIKIISFLKNKNKDDPDVVKRAKLFFVSCGNEAEIENLGVIPLNAFLQNNDLPLRPPYLGDLEIKSDFATILGKMRQNMMINFPFQIMVNFDPANKNKSRLELLVPKPGQNSNLPANYRPREKPAPPEQSDNAVTNTETDKSNNGKSKTANGATRKAAPNAKRKAVANAKRTAVNAGTTAGANGVERNAATAAKPKRVNAAKRKNNANSATLDYASRPQRVALANPSAIRIGAIGNFDVATRSLDTPTLSDGDPREDAKKRSRNSAAGNDDTEKGKLTPKKKVPKKKDEKKPDDEEKDQKKTPAKKTTKKKPTVKKTAKEDAEKENNEEKKAEKKTTGDETTDTDEEIVDDQEQPQDTKQQLNTSSNANSETAPNEEASSSLKITEDKNEPLINYMMEVANFLYDQTKNKLLDGKDALLQEKIDETASVFHEIEKMVAEARVNSSQKKSKEFTIKELQEFTNSITGASKSEEKPLIEWSNFIGNLLSYLPAIKQQFDEGRTIYVDDVNYLESVLKFLSTKNSRILYCALWWHAVRHSILDLPANLRAMEINYRKQAGLKDESRDEYCLAKTIESYGFATAYNYVIDEKTQANSKQAAELFGYYYGNVVQMIRSTDLSIIDPKTRMAAILRLDTGTYGFGIPWMLNNAQNLNKVYQSAIFLDCNYYFTRFFHVREQIRQNIANLNEDSLFTIVDPLHETTESSNQLNTFTVPLVFSQFPFMSTGLMSTNFGAMVMTTFRHAIHCFDALGNEYNHLGDRVRWWTKKKLASYRQHAQCYVDSYSKECYGENGCVNGKRTLDENIADNAALKATIQTYMNFQKVRKEPKLIDFESFTHLQLLTLSVAMTMCQDETPEKRWELLRTDKFPLPSARINQMMKNLPEFAEIWDCEEGDKMNPDTKCHLWGHNPFVKPNTKVENKQR